MSLDDPMMVTFLYAIAIAAGLFAVLASGLTLAGIRRLRMLRPESVALSPLEVPEQARSILAPGLQHLQALGFARPAAVRLVGQRIGEQPLLQFALALPHAAGPAVGYVVQLATPDRARQYGLFFVSRTRDGQTLLTRNRSSIAGYPPLPGLIVVDAWLPNWPALWQAHLDRMFAIQPDPAQWLTLPASEWIRLGAQFESAAFESRLARGDIVDAGDGSFRFNLRCALAMLARAWGVLIPSLRAMDEDKAESTVPAAAKDGTVANGIAGQVEAYEREIAAHRTSRWSKGAVWLLFLGTAAAAALSFGLSLDLSTVAALLAVLLLHELGHWAAMRWAGYKDLKVFFLPFIGAAVTGRHEQPTTFQELVVLFAGPVPGLVLGLALLLGWPADLSAMPWLLECAVLAVALNAFNLLPVHPLDGGKIFEILLLGRWPWLAFIGRVAGVVALGVLALAVDYALAQAVMLGVVALLAMGLGHQFREARVASSLRAADQWGGMPRPDALQSLFAAIGRLGYGSKPWPTQKLLADALLPAMMRPRLRRITRAGGLMLYALFLALPLLALIVYVWGLMPAAGRSGTLPAQMSLPASDADLAGYAAKRNAYVESLRTRLAAVTDLSARWTLLEAEIESIVDELAMHHGGALPAGQALLADAQALAAAQADATAAQAAVAVWRARAAAETLVRLQYLQSAMALYDAAQLGALNPAPLMQATSMWLHLSPDGDMQARREHIDKALSMGGTRPGLAGAETVRAYKLDDLLAQGQVASAQRLARDWFELALERDPSNLSSSALLAVDVTLVAEGPASALQLLAEFLAQIESRTTPAEAYTAGLRRHGLWLAEAAGRADWQREQVQRLVAPGVLGADSSFTTRALLWLMTRGQGAGATLADVERAHWQGDVEAAQRAARQMLQQRPDYVVMLPRAHDSLQGLQAVRVNLVQTARKAVYERYGLRVKAND